MELEQCCHGLESTKVTERSKCIKQILSLLQNPSTLQQINNGDTCNWDRIIFSAYVCLLHDADKYVDDMKKKNSSTVAYEANGITYFNVVAQAIKEGADIDFPKLFSYVKVFLDRQIMKQLYGKSCLVTLKEHILLSPKFRSHLEKDDWIELFTMLKKLCENQQSLSDSNYTQVECLALLIKWGPLYRLPPEILREEFNFIIEICRSVSQSSLRPHKEIVLTLAYDFCCHTAKDNRLASCKLGEELFLNFQDLYEINVREDRLKIQLIDFFLLQVVLHHPKGVEQNHAAAYACDWRYWNSYLRSLYWKLCDELNYNIERRNKNSVLFVNKNDHQEMRDNLVNLFIEVGRQVLNKVDSDVSTAASTSRMLDNTQAKRAKSEISMKKLIDNISETNNWPWVQIIYSLLRVYPDMIDKGDYIDLLRVLSCLQKQCNDQISRYHIYKCLTVMKDIESTIGIPANDGDVFAFWSAVGETTLKEVGLHLCNDVTENLLQKLISCGNIYKYQQILKIFNTSTNFTKNRIYSLYFYGQNFNFPKSDTNNIKRELIKSILHDGNLEKVDYFCCNITAKVLMNLVSKYWFSNEKISVGDNLKTKRPHNDISDIYFVTCFEDILITTSKNKQESEASQLPVIDNELNDFLFEALTVLTDHTIVCYPNDMELTLKVATLMKNVVSIYSINKFSFENNTTLLDALKKLIAHFTEKFVGLTKSDDEHVLKKLINSLELFYAFLTQTEDLFTVDTIINIIPYDLLKSFFEILNQNASKNYSSPNDLKFRFTLNTMKVLSVYCFVSGEKGIIQTQFHAFDAITSFDFDNTHDFEFTLSKTFLSEFSSCKPGTFPENSLKLFLDFLKNICSIRYYLYDSTVVILETFKLILTHLKVVFSESCITYLVNLLEPFYTRQNNYGPQISVLIIDCLDYISQIDTEFHLFHKWINDELVIFTISNFLCSDYQEVRFSAIKSIAKFFATETPQAINIQKEAFKRIFQLSLQVFELQGNINNERRIDETVTRSSSVLQTFANVGVCNKIWIQESLFSLIRITHMKKLNGTEKIMSLLAKHLEISHNKLISENIEYTLNRWDSFKYNLDAFPFDLCRCGTKNAFCIKYILFTIKLLIKYDDISLSSIAQTLNKDLKDILQEYCPKIFSDCICEEGAGNLTNIWSKNAILLNLNRKMGSGSFRQAIENNADLVILHLSQLIRDENDFKNNFNEHAAFPVFYGSSLTVKQFEDCLKFLEDICQVDNILEYLIRSEPFKVHKLTLELKLKLSETKANKSRIFHSYFIIVSLITRCLNKRIPFYEYFIKDTVTYLLNAMENFEEEMELIKIYSLAFYKFIKQILPDFSDSILPYFHIIINKLTNLSLRCEEINGCCIDILKVIIIEHSHKYSANIKMLDPFPSDAQFRELQRIYLQIRYENEVVPLEKDIEYFLKCGYETNFSYLREEGLRHLCKQLSTKKDELKDLYKRLEEMRGFSEDCEKSILHQLICMLLKLTTSNNSNVAIEACRCLGEMGPGNLSTLILQPEKSVTTQGLSPLEVLIGNVISYLVLFTCDANIKLVIAATEALYNVLRTKEGKMIAKIDKTFVNGKINQNYLVPFILSSKQVINTKLRIDEEMLISQLNHETLWCPVDNISHKDWIINLVCSVLEVFSESALLEKLLPVCKLKYQFCEEILPYLIHLILLYTKKELNDFVYEKIRYFFKMHWTSSVEEHGNENIHMIVMNKSSVRSMLNCVKYVRLQVNYPSTQTVSKDMLKLDYIHLAQAAQYCMQHFTAILYAELWCQVKYYEIIGSFTKEQATQYSRSKMLDVIYENIDSQTGKALEDILRNSYKTLGEFDALHGCGTSLFLDPSRRIEHYKDLGRWDQALLHHEIDVSNNKTGSMKHLVDSLKHCSLYKLPVLSSQSDEHEYECLWRLGQWNIDENKQNDANTDDCSSSDKFEKYRYFALKYLHDDDFHHFENILKEGTLSEIEQVKQTSLESCRNIYGILSHLQSLREIENFSDMKKGFQSSEDLLNKWKQQNSIMNNDFEYIEPIKTQRIVLLSDKFENTERLDRLVDLSLDLAQCARLENHLTVATRTISNLRIHENNLTTESKYRIQYEDAQLCWFLNDKISAHHILRHIFNNQDASPKIRSCALKLAGKWLIESLSENKNVIITDYLLESLELSKNLERNQDEVDNIYDTYDLLGRYADKEYQHIVEHMNSDMFQQKIKNMKRQKQVANSLLKSGKLTEDIHKAVKIHERQSAIDETEIENTEKEKNVLLKLALKYYLLNLTNSDKNDKRIFRVISLFFENRQNSVITEIINNHLPVLPSYKYINILPQIVPHISKSNENLFVEHINRVILKCLKEHPFHTLPLILSLVFANKDRQYTNSNANMSTNESRVSGATNLIEKVKTGDKKLGEIISKMEFMSDAIIQLAYYKATPTSKKQKEFSIPFAYKIRKIKNYNNILLPTITLPVSKSCDYNNIIGIHSFGDKFSNVGGINTPKCVTCRGTDGKVRTQLVKGSDDLRQDAVMQQVFTIMNSLLFANKNTKNLIIRTYKIVPLSMRSGILEWVDNSMPIGEYLVGNDDRGFIGAHRMYRPKDKTITECKLAVMNCANQSAKEKLRVFNMICDSFKPVFHKFFEYSFPQASIYYERRRAYIHSVATTSMCGYILGIGDRHVQNILIDKSTAEVIHIDFGIAFEQGRVLPTPETVPFRLTRDIVDGMGVCGVEGIFRKSCEKTMEVMRRNSQTILAILEVLLYDPLYTWAVTPAEAKKRQKNAQDESDVYLDSETNGDNSVNITAERALMRLKSKLHGTEDGYPVSLEHQVGTLIQQAQDPSNLCKLFRGWQAYL